MIAFCVRNGIRARKPPIILRSTVSIKLTSISLASPFMYHHRTISVATIRRSDLNGYSDNVLFVVVKKLFHSRCNRTFSFGVKNSTYS